MVVNVLGRQSFPTYECVTAVVLLKVVAVVVKMASLWFNPRPCSPYKLNLR